MPNARGGYRARGFARTTDHKRISVNMRLSAWERERLGALAADRDMSLTEYVLTRTVYADQEPIVCQEGELRTAVRELASQGAALNRTQKALSALASQGADGDDRVLTEVVAARESVNEAKRSIAGLQALLAAAVASWHPREG